MQKHYRHHIEIHGKPDRDWLILIHGAGGSSKSWYKQLAAFAEHFHVLVYDLRGHGKTAALNEHDEEEYSFHLIAQDLLSIMDQHHIRSAHLCGCSLGTVVMQELSLIAPERIDSMVMAGAVTKFHGWSKLLYMIARYLLVHILSKDQLYPLMAYMFMPFKLARGSRRLFIRESKKLCPDVFYKWWRLTYQFTIYHRLKEMRIPTLIVMGEYDYSFLSGSYLLLKKCPNATHHVLERAGHVCNMDQPRAFNKLAVEFLLGQSGAKSVVREEEAFHLLA
ncbi:alpha/beta fold hydrolase [Brevibacillus dissolubilis]|uniref:alpha/beta fold hydrolase n=1 Tax=Brevibacillus dissolubilis TaxID=1844116 RepID=UPI00159BDC3F|nr:alpha/beta hydrolase [Brevibacillus dissolubilis]